MLSPGATSRLGAVFRRCSSMQDVAGCCAKVVVLG